jgi:hypothetical protein
VAIAILADDLDAGWLDHPLSSLNANSIQLLNFLEVFFAIMNRHLCK